MQVIQAQVQSLLRLFLRPDLCLVGDGGATLRADQDDGAAPATAGSERGGSDFGGFDDGGFGDDGAGDAGAQPAQQTGSADGVSSATARPSQR